MSTTVNEPKQSTSEGTNFVTSNPTHDHQMEKKCFVCGNDNGEMKHNARMGWFHRECSPCTRAETPTHQMEEVSDWKVTFRKFYDDNEQGGSSRWLVAPNVVEVFIRSVEAHARQEGKQEAVKRIKKVIGAGNVWGESEKRITNVVFELLELTKEDL